MTVPDEQERLAALDTTTSHHVESPAGAGKTLLLTTRFLKLLTEVRHPREIVALTFTEKAAREMKSRIACYLRMALADTPPTSEFERKLYGYAAEAVHRHRDAIHYLTSSDGLLIMTFHAFCYYMMQRAPLEAGVAPDCRIVADVDFRTMCHDAVTESMTRIAQEADGTPVKNALEGHLLRLNGDFRQLAEDLTTVIRNRGLFTDIVSTIADSGGDTEALADTLHKRLEIYIRNRLHHLRTIFAATPLGAEWSFLIEDLRDHAAVAGDALPPELPGTHWHDLPSWQSVASCLLTKQGAPRKSFGPSSGFYSGFKKTRWGSLISSLSSPLTGQLQDIVLFPPHDDINRDNIALTDFLILAAETIVHFEAMLRKRHCVDFTGLEQAALRLLNDEDPSDLHLHLDSTLRHLLVDEFQDTNYAQWRMIQQLTSGWQPGDGRTVFLVGDPKQSIYSFRNAEVQLFFRAAEGIPLPSGGTLPLSHLTLTTNFRSTGKLIRWTNDIFSSTVMANPDTDVDEVFYHPACPVDDAPDGDDISLTVFAKDTKSEAVSQEAQWIAGSIKDTIARTQGKESIAVLLFTRRRLTTYLSALKDTSIPAQIQEGLSLTDRPEVSHLLHACRFFARPHDDCAAVSLLRSPWSWCDLDTVHSVSTQTSFSWQEKIRRASTRSPVLENLSTALDTVVKRLGRDSLGDVVRRFWEDCNGPAATAYIYGMAGVANCRHFLQLLDGLEQGTPLETVRRLESGLDELYEPADPTTTDSPVSVMTIHRAKGLEFDRVFIPALDWRPLADRPTDRQPYHVETVPGCEGLHMIAMPPDRRYDDTGSAYTVVKDLTDKRRWGEAKRWFYVAVTRARKSLVMSAACRCNDDDISIPKNSVLSWVWEHYGLDTGMTLPATSDLTLSVNPPVPPAVRDQEPAHPRPDGTAWTVTPESPPYVMTTPPSHDSDAAFQQAESSLQYDAAAGDRHRIRGILIHKLLQTAIDGASMPSENSVVRALRAEGMTPSDAAHAAGNLIDEAAATLNDPFIKELVTTAGNNVKTEWRIENIPITGHIRPGIIDLAVHDGRRWWIIDFKTSRPYDGEYLDEFFAREVRLYHSQIQAYEEMIRAATGDGSSNTKKGLYFTAFQRWYELNF